MKILSAMVRVGISGLLICGLFMLSHSEFLARASFLEILATLVVCVLVGIALLEIWLPPTHDFFHDEEND